MSGVKSSPFLIPPLISTNSISAQNLATSFKLPLPFSQQPSPANSGENLLKSFSSTKFQQQGSAGLLHLHKLLNQESLSEKKRASQMGEANIGQILRDVDRHLDAISENSFPDDDEDLINSRRTTPGLRKKFEVADPFVAKKPKFVLPKLTVWLSFIGFPIIGIAMQFLCLGIDQVSGKDYTAVNLIHQLADPSVDPNEDKKIFHALIPTMGVMFGIVLTTLGIVLELSASRFTGSVASIFFRDLRVLGTVAYVVIANVVCFFVFESTGSAYSGRYPARSSVVIVTIMVVLQLVGVFPFMNYLFLFLDSQKVVTAIVMNGLKGVTQSVQDQNGMNVEMYQNMAIKSIEHLRDAAERALRKRDKNIAAKAVDALCSFQLYYGRYKHQMFDHWYYVPMWIRQAPDFLTLSDEAVKEIANGRTWLEWKILRQYNELYNESIIRLKEVCYHIAMNTRFIGEAAGAERGDIHTLDLAIKFFNTYLRAGINNAAVHTVYIVLYQYRRLGESLLQYCHDLKQGTYTFEHSTITTTALIAMLNERVVQIAKYMRYYSLVCLSAKPAPLPFLVEVISHDIRFLCEQACKWESTIHEKLLEVFLTVHDNSESGQRAVRGVRRAQICLATSYLVANKPEYAMKIHEDFADEPKEALMSLMVELQSAIREFWEVSERGTNFTFISDEQKAQLPVFFSWFKQFAASKEEPTLPKPVPTPTPKTLPIVHTDKPKRHQDLVVTDL